MSYLIVETGAGVANANVYDTMDGISAYHEVMGNQAWADAADSPDDDRESAFIRGTAYIEGKYGPRLNGKKKSGRSQSLMFPQVGMTDASGEAIADDEVPIEWKRATYVAALRELVSPNSLMPDYDGMGRVKSETLGPLSVTYMDAVDGAADSQPVIEEIDRILQSLIGYTTAGGGRVMTGTTTRI